MEKSGKWLILAILAIALALGAFSWWFRWSATHRAAAFWGSQTATTIRDARQVEAYRLADAKMDTGETLVAGDRRYSVEKRIDVSKGRGLVHLKQALLEDRSYEWENLVANGEFVPRWALVFHPVSPRVSGTPVTLLFDEACERGMGMIEGTPPRSFDCKPIAAGITAVLAEWFSAE